MPLMSFSLAVQTSSEEIVLHTLNCHLNSVPEINKGKGIVHLMKVQLYLTTHAHLNILTVHFICMQILTLLLKRPSQSLPISSIPLITLIWHLFK